MASRIANPEQVESVCGECLDCKAHKQLVITEDLDEGVFLDVYLKAEDFRSVLMNMDNYLRNRLKYEEKLTKGQTKVLQETRDSLWEELKNAGLNEILFS